MIKYYETLEQGSEEWFEARRGLMTASEMKFLVSKTLKLIDDEKERDHCYELAAQRISGWVEQSFITDDMLRGNVDEVRAKAKYQEVYKTQIENMGFITNDKFGFTMGFSPDGMLDGRRRFLECKSRRQKFQLRTINGYKVPREHVIQVQTGLMISECESCDFVSYSGGWPMVTIPMKPDPVIQDVIFQASYKFEKRIKEIVKQYEHQISRMPLAFIPTERVLEPTEIKDE